MAQGPAPTGPQPAQPRRWRPAPAARLAFCAVLMAAAHAALIFGITLSSPEPQGPIIQSVAVTLGRSGPDRGPTATDLPATSQPAPSNAVDQPTTRALADRPQTMAIPPAAAAPEEPPRRKSTAAAASHRAPTSTQPLQDAAPVPAPPGRRQIDIAAALATLNADQSLERQSDTGRHGGQPRTRRLSQVAPRSPQQAYYLNALRRRIETIGKRNYPGEARRRNLSGSLRLLVALNVDGTLHDVQVIDTSGIAVLDQAALRIVRLAAPFPPLPRDLAEGIDVLEITRTWRFGNNSYSADGRL